MSIQTRAFSMNDPTNCPETVADGGFDPLPLQAVTSAAIATVQKMGARGALVALVTLYFNMLILICYGRPAAYFTNLQN